MRRRRKFTYSRTSPTNDRRACLCPDGRTYSRKCCDGSLQAQGIGGLGGGGLIPTPEETNAYVITSCENGHHHNAHYHGTLTVGGVYYMNLQNNHNGCYTVTEERDFEGLEITSIIGIPFDDCDECTTISDNNLDPEGDPAPSCPDRVLVFQICNSNAIKDDNFDIYLNGTKIGDVDLNFNELIGSVFIASTNTDLAITGADFTCPIEGMVVHRFDPSLLYSGTNTIYMKNTQNNASGNAGVLEVRNYEVSGNNLLNPCDIQDLTYAGSSGSNFYHEFTFNECCP